VHAVDEHLLRVCVTETNEPAVDGLVAALSGVA
jgi:hypothetical protein